MNTKTTASRLHSWPVAWWVCLYFVYAYCRAVCIYRDGINYASNGWINPCLVNVWKGSILRCNMTIYIESIQLTSNENDVEACMLVVYMHGLHHKYIIIHEGQIALLHLWHTVVSLGIPPIFGHHPSDRISSYFFQPLTFTMKQVIIGEYQIQDYPNQ